MFTVRYVASCAVVSGQLYITGGFGSSNTFNCLYNALKHAERFDVVAGAWGNLPTMFYGHSGHASFGISGRLYVTAGKPVIPSDGPHLHVERFDPVLGLWECLHQLPARTMTR